MTDLQLWWPLATLGMGAALVYLIARFLSRRNGLLAGVTFAIHLVALFFTLHLAAPVLDGAFTQWTPSGALHAKLMGEPGAFLVATFSLTLGALVALYSGRYLALDHRYEDYYPLLLGLSAGVFGMVMAADIFILYLFTGFTGIISYVLVAFRRRERTAIEAGFKYAVMGGTGAMLMLAGMGYIIRAGGDLTFDALPRDFDVWSTIGIALVMGGLGIKAAIVPAHTWVPDAYGRAPSSISAMLSGALSQAYLYVFIKAGLGLGWSPLLLGRVAIVAAVLNMLIGNLMAFMQDESKRLLAYSSVAQNGYILLALGLGLTLGRPELLAAAFFMLTAHGVLKALAFLSKGVGRFYLDMFRIAELQGLYHRMPLIGFCLALSLAGLAGLPPLVGFIAKWQILAAIPTWDILTGGLVALFVINVLLSLGYYIPPIYRVFTPPIDGERIRGSGWMLVPLTVMLIAIIGLGILPGGLYSVAEQAAEFLLGWGIT